VSAPNPKIDRFVAGMDSWREAFERLRPIIQGCGLDEAMKWGWPCYSLDGRNVCLIHGFKEYCAILIVKGALLDDPAGILVQQTENVQSARQIRFTSAEQIAGMANVIADYVQRAIAVEKSGAKVEKKTTREFEVAEEFRLRLDTDRALKAAFEALTPGRQRGWLLYFSSAKQAKTRAARVEASAPLILAGKGRED
jgi:uncharacterized protein YdeI (YjbR/CyaY-like superfamily)